jgi:hypothetical protein
MIKHFVWSYNNETGRVAVSVDGDRITVRQIAGMAPPWSAEDATAIEWSNVLNNAFHGPSGEPLRVWAQDLSAQRVNRFAVQTCWGKSGSRNYLLRVERDAALADYPIAAVLHVSMYGKLNEGLSMWLGDFAELNNAIIGDVDDETPDAAGLVIREVPTAEGLEWQTAEPWPQISTNGTSLLAAIYGDGE